nr:MAG TPA: holin [Caudoviricetes sp.]
MTDIIYYAIGLVIAIVTFLLGKYVFPTMKNSEEFTNITNWVYKFVISAKNQFINGTGEEKREYVTKQIKTLCEKYKIDLTDDQIRALIEEAYDLMKANLKES